MRRTLPVLLLLAAPLVGCDAVVQTILGQEEAGEDATARAEGDIDLPTSVLGEPLPASAHPDVLRWSTPTCPLRYRFQSDETIAMPGFPGPSGTDGLRMTGEVVMESGGDGRSRIRNGDLELSHVMQGIKRPGGIQPRGTLAEIRLAHDGSTWSEVEGPTALWSAYGTFPGLVVFWPGLPAGTSPGSQATWQLTSHERGAGMQVEVERGTAKVPEGTTLPTPSPTRIPEQVTLESLTSVQGQPAAVLTGRLTHAGEESLVGQRVAYSMEQQSTYVVLASGRLLYAQVVRTTDVTMSFPDGHSMEQTQQMNARIGLVDACDGPTVDEPPVADASPKEKALAAVARLRNALNAGQGDEAATWIAPKILETHGREAVMATLREHVERHGFASLGAVELAQEIEHDGDRVLVEVWGPTEYFRDGYDLSLTYVFDVRDGNAKLVSLQAKKQYHDDDPPLLEVSATRLATREPPRGEPLE